MQKPLLIEEIPKLRPRSPDIADVCLVAARHAGENYGSAGFDGEEEEVEDVAADVADAAVGVGEAEDEVGVPGCAVAVGFEGKGVVGVEGLGGEPVADEFVR